MNKVAAPARYIMIGGFLGAGKTTSVLKLAQYLDKKGLKVGLITNDQGQRLVDTMNLDSHGFTVEEIAGGCFCCRFNSLLDAADNLTRESTPDVFIAEPVGSCTDLVASVSYPLRRIYGERFRVAPLSVVVDPLRALRVLGLSNKPAFSDKVTYIYLKQLEEADIIVINKQDLLSPEQMETLKNGLSQRFPKTQLLIASAREELGLDEWYSQLLETEWLAGDVMDMDYKVYAEGEALLGWLNATIELKAETLIDGDLLLEEFTRNVSSRLADEQIEIAHFKLTMSPYDNSGELAVISLVGNEYAPEFSQSLSDPLDKGQIIVNLRAEGHPNQLKEAVLDAISGSQGEHISLELDHLECFKPSEPKPIYRMSGDSDITPVQA